MQLMLDIFEFADGPAPPSPPDRYPKVFEVSWFRGYRPVAGPDARAPAFPSGTEWPRPGRSGGHSSAWKRWTTPVTPLSSIGPISRNVRPAPSVASMTSRLTSTSPGRAYSPIREATLTV